MNNIDLLKFLNKVETKFPNLSWRAVYDNEVVELYAYINWGLEEEDYLNLMIFCIQKLNEKVQLDIDLEPYDTIVSVSTMSEIQKSSIDLIEWRSCDEDYVLDCLYRWLRSLSKEVNTVV